MKPRRTLFLVLFLFLGAPSAILEAQQTPPRDEPATDTALQDAEAETPGLAISDEPPAGWAPAERARSRECVPTLARIEAVNEELGPKRQRMARIEALHRAVTLEDSARVTPLDPDDPLEQAVEEWFRADLELANRYLETEDEAIREERRAAREAMLQRLEDAHQEVSEEASAIVESNRDLERGLHRCQGRIFIRSAVLEACDDESSPVCQAARSEEPDERFQFVESARELWDVERFRSWSEPSPVRPMPTGQLGGARTESPTQRGNAGFIVGLEPSIQARSNLSEEQVARYETHLDSLGFEFGHPEIVMSPALTFEIDVPGRLGDETHYLLHFGDLSAPERDVIHTLPVPDEWPLRGYFLPDERTLVRLAQGEPLSLTAVQREDDETNGSPVFSLGVTPVMQSQRVAALLQYMMGGELESDLTALVPPGEEDTPGDPGAVPEDGDGVQGDPGTP